MKESDLEKYFKQEVLKAGGYAVKLDAKHQAGLPDRLVIWPGRMELVELKTDKGQISKIQKWFHKLVRGYGLEVKIVRGKGGVDEYARRF